jgi:hypothetical protein
MAMTVRALIGAAAVAVAAAGAVDEGTRATLVGFVREGHQPAGIRLVPSAGCRTLSDAQLAAVAGRAGWAGERRVEAVAVQLAESGGNTCATGDQHLQGGGWGPSTCTFQIRSRVADRGTGGLRDELANHDPATCAAHARRIYLQAGGWSPWGAWTNGSYAQYLLRARRAVR